MSLSQDYQAKLVHRINMIVTLKEMLDSCEGILSGRAADLASELESELERVYHFVLTHTEPGDMVDHIYSAMENLMEFYKTRDSIAHSKWVSNQIGEDEDVKI